MNIIEKVESTKVEQVPNLENKKISQILQKFYGFNVLKQSVGRFLEKTVSSKVYRCKTKEAGVLVVKESFWYTDTDLKLQEQSVRAVEYAYFISEVLRKRGVLLPKIFSNKQGNFVTVMEKNKVTVLEYLRGNHFSFQDKEFISSGAALGIFHRKGAEYLKENPKEKRKIARLIPVEKPYEDSRKMYYKFLRKKLLSRHNCSVPEVCKKVRENLKAIDETIKFIDSSGVSRASLSSGVIHNDFHINNALFQNKKFIGFIDIDQVGIGPYVWDVGNTLGSFAARFLLENDLKNFESKVRLFLAAYHHEFPLPPDEYRLCLAATQRWDIMRILRSLRRHHYENDRLSGLLPKIKSRFIPRIIAMPEVLGFMTANWLKSNLLK